MGRDQYTWEALNQLNNTEYYTKLPKPIYTDTIPKIRKILDTLKDKKYINHKQHTYLLGNPVVRPRRFYTLPKIHKNPATWSIPFQIPPGRPIVSDIDSESYKTAEYLEHFLTPISTKHKSYIKDTYHFTEIIKNLTTPTTAYLFTMDINSLYTNIETPAGIQAVKATFQKYPDKKRPDRELLQLLEINLTTNDFEFDTHFYLQIKGTAMGKKFAPAYANIFMATWEEEALRKCPKQPLHYHRYLDDIFGIWTHTEQEFLEFTNILNNHHPSIKLTSQLDPQTINFLDTTVYKGPTFGDTNKLDIKVYFKDTDTHALLHKNSYHPKHTFKGIVKSQLLRFKRICTTHTDFITATKTLFTALRHRGYSRPFLRKCYKTYLDTRPIDTEDIIPLITTYSPINQQFGRKIKHNFQTILQNQGYLQNHKIISAHRRNKNLQDYLIHAKLKPLRPPKNKTDISHYQKITWINDSLNQNTFQTQKNIKPTTKNCIYLIWCNACHIKYVGETGNAISTRLTQHRYNIRNKRQTQTALVAHFIKHNLKELRYTGLQHNPTWKLHQRQKEERKWIKQLKTKQPLGLNIH
ncbi:hypothetical protein ACEWY4_027645 [Coilia grayii]|uniref:Reverse transcriptase domain-containing protein n=1 Tax=Coilia grayii TaxID=363190 RepID=A0ABD1ITA9_9TELE